MSLSMRPQSRPSISTQITPSTTTALRKKCFHSQIPLLITLSTPSLFPYYCNNKPPPSTIYEDDNYFSGGSSATSHACLPYVLNARRMAYLPMYLEDIVNYYKMTLGNIDGATSIGEKGDMDTISEASNKEERTEWFVLFSVQCEGQVVSVPWHLPIGVINDIYNNTSNINMIHPMRISVTLTTTSTIHTFGNITEMKLMYYSLLKQSDYMRWRNKRRVSCMSRPDQLLLWDCLLNASASKWWKINAGLLDTLVDSLDYKWADYCMKMSNRTHDSQESMQFEYEDDKDAFGFIPMRLHYCSYNPTVVSVKLMSVHPFTSDGMTMLGDVLGGTSSAVRIHGVIIPLNTPLLWLAHHMAYTDNILHLVITE